MLTTIEKVLLLQEVEIFEFTTTQDLALIAAITGEYTFEAGQTIYHEGDVSDSMYVIVDGKVILTHGKQTVMEASNKGVFGTWALFDDEPRVVTAKTISTTHFLKINRDDFYELLADHIHITQGVLKTMSKRLRRLVERVRTDIPNTGV